MTVLPRVNGAILGKSYINVSDCKATVVDYDHNRALCGLSPFGIYNQLGKLGSRDFGERNLNCVRFTQLLRILCTLPLLLQASAGLTVSPDRDTYSRGRNDNGTYGGGDAGPVWSCSNNRHQGSVADPQAAHRCCRRRRHPPGCGGVDIKRRPASQIPDRKRVWPQPSHSSAPPESRRSHTSSSGGVDGPDSTPAWEAESQVIESVSGQRWPGNRSVSFLVSFMFVYLGPSPSTTWL